jgi:GNAT superfamily N-acetyltransferase
MLRRQKQGRCYWLLIEMNGVIIGNGQLVIHRYTAECANLFVVPEHRSQGIGTGLMEVLTAVARHCGLKNLEIGVTLDNPRALSLYQRFGFATDRHVQFPHSQPAIILHKVI